MEALKLLPVEPDDAMIEAGEEEIASRRSLGCAIYASDVYEAMVRAYEPEPDVPSADPRPAAQPGVVKGLEWIEAEGNYPGQTVWSPKNDIWPCWIVKNLNSDSYIWCEEIGIELAPASPVMGGFQSLDAAKAAAQADYERRILSQIDFAALAAPVSQEPVAWLTEWRFHKSGSDVKHAGGGSSITRDPNDAAAKFKFYQDWDHVESVTQTPLFASPQPLTEGEPTEAEVERIASWIAADTFQHLAPWSVDGAVADVLHGAIQTAARSALLAAKSKGGQADG